MDKTEQTELAQGRGQEKIKSKLRSGKLLCNDKNDKASEAHPIVASARRLMQHFSRQLNPSLKKIEEQKCKSCTRSKPSKKHEPLVNIKSKSNRSTNTSTSPAAAVNTSKKVDPSSSSRLKENKKTSLVGKAKHEQSCGEATTTRVNEDTNNCATTCVLPDPSETGSVTIQKVECEETLPQLQSSSEGVDSLKPVQGPSPSKGSDEHENRCTEHELEDVSQFVNCACNFSHSHNTHPCHFEYECSAYKTFEIEYNFPFSNASHCLVHPPNFRCENTFYDIYGERIYFPEPDKSHEGSPHITVETNGMVGINSTCLVSANGELYNVAGFDVKFLKSHPISLDNPLENSIRLDFTTCGFLDPDFFETEVDDSGNIFVMGMIFGNNNLDKLWIWMTNCVNPDKIIVEHPAPYYYTIEIPCANNQ